MDSTLRAQFVKTAVVLCPLALVAAAILSPPDPFTLVLYAGPLLAFVPIVSYALTYGGGYDYLRSTL